MWCLTAGCDTVCHIQEAKTSLQVSSQSSRTKLKTKRNKLSYIRSITCPTCAKSYCAECKLIFHPEASCEAFRRRLMKEGNLSLDDEDLCSLDFVKRCPFCHIPIEKDSGCAQMMCKRCKHVFCWYCLTSLDVSVLQQYSRSFRLKSYIIEIFLFFRMIFYSDIMIKARARIN